MVLYDLERMRNNEIFNRYLEPENMKQLMKMYRYRSILAEQDWFTNLGFTNPDLFYVLPCTYNAQTTLEYMREGPEKDFFDDYHFCDKFHNLKVVHYNGCGSQPINCGHTGDPSKHMSQGNSFSLLRTVIINTTSFAGCAL
ncbi:xyloside xylosyltransferase 1 [Eurytemora carolleeae]|uniref:xyloside xylosyltransferase 1 n=1 Tax=Eurytemora carolleeae TaxID=1294199 RepID=UPI000C765FDF|nr:xyloside xylosyltransferase 1 [Eurytemora carolleeae]|eukprot:XP_023346611.1 xyloside xylosyltransferase 1-like [Eurytemora affinis]